MKKRITLTLFAVFCILGAYQQLEAQTKPIDGLLERLEQVGDYHGSISDFFTQAEQLQLKAHFSENRDISPLSAKDLERGSGVAASCAMNATGEFGTFDPSNGSTVTAVGASPIGGEVFENAGSINPFDPNEAWVLANNGDAYTVDVATGTYTLVGSVGNNWVAAEFDQSTGLFYALDGLGDLYTVDVPGLTANLVGSTGLGALLPIGLAIDGDGNGYVYEIAEDNLYSVDLGTGSSSVIGNIGFDANFGQGMFWNSATDTVLMTAFNNGLFDSELRSVDTATGATTLVNQMDAGALTQYAWSSAPATTPPPPPPPCTVFEDFEEGLPEGWSTVVNTGDCDWDFTSATPTGDDFETQAIVFDDDACGNGAPASNLSILSDVYDTSNATSILVGYDVYFQEFGDQEFVVEVWDGTEWQQIAIYNETLDPDIQTEADIDATEFANADFQVRWTYSDIDGSWGWGAGLDNFCMNLSFPDPANVQVIHNSPDPAGEFVDVYVNGVLAIDDFEFRTSTPFLELPSGVDITIDIAGASSGVLGDPLDPADSLYDITAALDAGENYLLVANGVLDPGAFITDNAFEITVYTGARTAADDPAGVDVLVHHGSPDAPPVDVNEPDAGNLVSNIAYPEFQGYLSLPVADYVLEVAAAGTPDALVAYQAPLATLGGFEGAAITVIASGFFGEDAGETNGFGLWAASAAGGPLLELPLVPDAPDCTVFEDFETGLPDGWSTVVNTGDCDWDFTSATPTGDDFPTQAIVFDDDACGNGAPASNVSILSAVYDATDAESILLGYDVYFQEFGDQEFVVEVWDGAEWQQIAIYNETLDPDIQTEADIDATEFANADFQVRWTYSDIDGSWGWGAGLDNFCLNLVLPPPPPPCTVFEDFEAGLPAGWSTVVNTGDCDWDFTSATPTGDDFETQAIVFDDDACGNGAPASSVSILSDVYDTSGASSILIGYDVYFQEFGDQEFVVEVWDGTEWQQIAIYNETLDPDIQTEVDIDATEFANADFQVRWTYSDIDGSWGWGAGLDNFCLNFETLGTTDNEIAGFDYYPNPATNELNLSARSNIDNVAIYNILGQKVIDQNVGSMSTRLDVSMLSAGTYIMRVSADGQTASYKIVKR